MADNNKKKGDKGKKGHDDNWMPGCVDFFVMPIQVLIVGSQLLNLV